MKLFGIKFYNPWKPHIVVDGFGLYRVRIMKGTGWKYWDNDYLTSVKEWSMPNKNIWYAEYELEKTKQFIAEEKEYSKKKSVADKVVHEE